MELKNKTKEMIGCVASYFDKEHKKTKENIALCAYAMVRCETVNTAQMARVMHEVNNQSFKSNDMRVYRLLQSHNFQVSDRTWRGHINLVFDLLKSLGLRANDLIQVNVDFTSDRDDFLILCASIVFESQSIPIYFSLRNYPKKKGAIDQKKMELAFFKALRHILPDNYRYCIVADRGFGNQRILEILENLEFDYVLRLTDTINVVFQDKITLAAKLPHQNIAPNQTHIPCWERTVYLSQHVRDEAKWLLLASSGINDPRAFYERRFNIEKMFKNIKSGGFDLERLLISKYDRFKRILFIACVAYAILITTGLFIEKHAKPIKKNFNCQHDILSAFSL